MNELNNRFVEFYNYLISQNIVKSGREFANEIDVSSSLITEIIKGRSVVGTKAIQNSVIKYNLNSDWLFTNQGEKIKSEPTGVIIDENLKSFIMDRYDAIAGENAILKKENEDLKQIIESNNKEKFYSIASEPGEKYPKK